MYWRVDLSTGLEGVMTVDLKAADRQRDRKTQRSKKKEKKLKKRGRRGDALNPSAVCGLVIFNQSTSTADGLQKSVTFYCSPGGIPNNNPTHTDAHTLIDSVCIIKQIRIN